MCDNYLMINCWWRNGKLLQGVESRRHFTSSRLRWIWRRRPWCR